MASRSHCSGSVLCTSLQCPPTAQRPRNVRCHSKCPENDKAWEELHMPGLWKRIEEVSRSSECTGSVEAVPETVVVRPKSKFKPPVWSISRAASEKPHSFRDTYWIESSDDESPSLHERFGAYVRSNEDNIDISGRPPVPSSDDMAVMMEQQWEEMSAEIEKWHQKKWNGIRDREDKN